MTKLNVSGSALIYSTYLGGSLTDEGRAIAVDSSGSAYATGDTSSFDFPMAGAFQGGNGGGQNNHDDAYVVKISNTSPAPTPTPTPAPAPTLTSLTVNPSSVTGGGSAQGVVTLSGAAPAGGAVVMLSSSNTSAATVPASATVPANATGVSFTVTTKPVSAATAVTVSASYGGLTRTAPLTVNPAQTADTVAIQRAEYTASKRQLRVNASGTSPTATLKAYVTATGALIGTLDNRGGKYSGQFSWPTNPQNITVRSSLGGSASAPVIPK